MLNELLRHWLHFAFEQIFSLSLSQIQDHFNITKDTAQKLTKFKKPSNKSKYTNIYNTLVSVTDVGVLKDFILPE